MSPSNLLPIAALLAALAFPASAVPLERDDEAPARAAATKTVRVVDGAFSPKRLTVAKDTKIKWVWSKRNVLTHTVYLDDRPKGVRQFRSAPASRSATFTRKLRKAGTYKLLCTFHSNMRMRIDVER
ncbi:MAG TPA: cupredoxin domain-containing protein [Thermoleophilaceae bacterium]|nr:cupredoxin domain-containing protein [Thermoleophilaceae bacterium]